MLEQVVFEVAVAAEDLARGGEPLECRPGVGTGEDPVQAFVANGPVADDEVEIGRGRVRDGGGDERFLRSVAQNPGSSTARSPTGTSGCSMETTFPSAMVLW